MMKELKVLFYLKRNEQQKNEAIVMGRITVNFTMAQFSCRVKIDPAIWNSLAQRCVGRSTVAGEVNRELQRLDTLIHIRYDEMVNSGAVIMANRLKEAFQGVVSSRQTLLGMYAEFIREYGKRVGADRSKTTYELYRYNYRLTEQFIKDKYKTPDISLRAMAYDTIEKYEAYLKYDRHFRPTTIYNAVNTFKMLGHLAVGRGYIAAYPFEGHRNVTIEYAPKYLPKEELNKLMQGTVSRKYRLTRDMFLFSTMTGICYRDMCNLTESDISTDDNGRMWIEQRRQKTGTRYRVMLLELAEEIVRRYILLNRITEIAQANESGNAGKTDIADKTNHTNQTDNAIKFDKTQRLFPMPSNGVINAQLKKLAKECGIERRLTFHMARHTFGSEICLSQGVPIETVSQMMGHRDIVMTQHYAKVTDDKIREDVDRFLLPAEGEYSLSGIDSLPLHNIAPRPKGLHRKRKTTITTAR